MFKRAYVGVYHQMSAKHLHRYAVPRPFVEVATTVRSIVGYTEVGNHEVRHVIRETVLPGAKLLRYGQPPDRRYIPALDLVKVKS